MHQRLVEMTNNDVNAWSIFRPVVPSTGDSWDGDFDEYSNNENFQVGNPLPRNSLTKLMHSTGPQPVWRILPRDVCCCPNPKCRLDEIGGLLASTSTSVSILQNRHDLATAVPRASDRNDLPRET